MNVKDYNMVNKKVVEGITRISHIGVHAVYYKTSALFSSIKSQIYNKDKREWVKVIISYTSAMD